MFKKLTKLLFICFLITFIASCDVDLENNVDGNVSTITISELEHTEQFRSGALEHILEGELNNKGQAVGFHYEGMSSKKGKVIEGTETVPNEFGVYEAEVAIENVKKDSNNGISTFFPREWDAQQVVDAINEAYQRKVFISGNTYEGLTSEGLTIRMYLDRQEKIISAFPIY